MDKEERSKLEAAIRERHTRGEIAHAVELAIDGYGPEIYGYLINIMRSRDEATEVFERFCEDVRRGFGGFRWASSLRTWAYVVARRARCRFQQGAAQKPHHVPLADAEGHAALMQKVRTQTEEWAKSSVRDAVRDLRRQLPEEDQTILILRIDRDLSWEDVARVTGGLENGDQDRDVLRREVNRVKKRYERAVEQLRGMALKHGLIREEE